MLHHCVVLFSGPQGSWIALFGYKNTSYVFVQEGVDGEASFINLPVMNSFNKTNAAIFPVQVMLL